MTHSNLTRWIEDADARDALLQAGMVSPLQETASQHHVHLPPVMKMVGSWWHHGVTSLLPCHDHAPVSANRH